MTLAVIDYGAGNLRSVLHALHHLGTENIQLVQEPDQLKGAERIILPGVGAFGAGMQQLHKQDLVEPLKDAIASGLPYLGICLGMQFLFERSNEMGDHAGLGILPGNVTRFPEMDLKVPHMGWNQLIIKQDSPILENVSEESYAYFVHSYYCEPADQSDILIEADYGLTFCAGVHRENIFGVQFHPEKSQQTGLTILRNFLALESIGATS
ncbi:MAG: imidazole glycerol phosphate synthase subunit HisH [Anaerolineaceae bacterium]|nr:imidazole glycerol phosphate synthase subunit HisH [Anaerolineaceae bacterium]